VHFNFVDYSKSFFRSRAKKNIPLKRTGKFVQLRNYDSEYLVLAPKEMAAYHANIVERFFTEQRIKGAYNKKRDLYTTKDTEWDIVGGGVWAINEGEKSLAFSGRSIAYGSYDRRGLKDRLSAVKVLSGYQITID
jgi:hypothetical protein